MKGSRRDFLKKCYWTGISLFGGGVLFEVASGRSIIDSLTNDQSIKLAMAIDLKRCIENENCIDCISACHINHKVPNISNSRHEIKWIWKERLTSVFSDTIHRYMNESLTESKSLVLCNHCDNPPCVRVCPTGATWKREDGIVMMDQHRCIGCRYCMAGCPYSSRSFNWVDPRDYLTEEELNQNEYPTRTRGVVEKCDFCAEEIDRGRKPLCEASCESDAIYFGNLNDEHSEVREMLQQRFAIRRKPELGTGPEIYYLV